MRHLSDTALLLMLLWSLAASAQAGSFSVNPIRLEMKSGQRSTSLVVTNHGSEPSLLQVRLYRWTHAGQQDQLTEADAAEAPVITPPLFKLAAGGASQIIRIGFPKAQAPEDGEAQWRVVVEEVPQPPPSPDSAAAGEGAVAINMRLRVSLPLFRRPLQVSQDLQWQGVVNDGALQLAAHNQGSVTERIDALSLTTASGEPALVKLAGPIYLFPGEAQQWSLKADQTVKPGSLQLSLTGTPRQRVSTLEVRAQ